MGSSPEVRRQRRKALHAAVQALVDTYFRVEGPEHTLTIAVFVRDGRVQNWKTEVTHRPTAE